MLVAKVTCAVKEMKTVVHRLDRVFYNSAAIDNKRNHAATQIVAATRGFLVRTQYKKMQAFLGQWREQNAKIFLDSMMQFNMRLARIDVGMAKMTERSRLSILKRIFTEIRNITTLERPFRRQRKALVDVKFQQKMRIILCNMWNKWKNIALGPQSRKRMVLAYRERQAKCRERLEALQRYVVLSKEMIQEELQKDNIRTIRERSTYHRQRMYFRLLLRTIWIPLQTKMAKAKEHFRQNVSRRVGRAWISYFRTVQVEKAIQRVNANRTFERFPQHYNLRRIEYHYRRTVLMKHMKAWTRYLDRHHQVQQRFETSTVRMLRNMLKAWHVRATYQNQLRAAAVVEWKQYCHRIFKVGIYVQTGDAGAFVPRNTYV
jgi:hypothetical protein